MKQTLALGLILALAASPVRAEMRDWQLRRLLNFRTDCQMDDFVDRSESTGPGRFHASCRNITFYPNGIDLECPDRIDEWTCKIVTRPQSFDALDMLHQGPSK